MSDGFDGSGNHYSDCTGPYCDCDERRYGGSGGGGGGCITAIISLVIGFFIMAFLFSSLGIDVDSVSSGVIVIILIVITSIVGAIISNK